MSTSIAIIDYGMGNRRSVEKAFAKVGAQPSLSAERDQVLAADGAVVIGVGAFPTAMRRLGELGMLEVLRERCERGRPILGICLGLQILFEGSEEHGGAAGLALLKGQVRRLPANGLKLPHIGWNQVEWSAAAQLGAGAVEADSTYYHLHSYAALDSSGPGVTGTAVYGRRFVTAVEKPPLYGVQFHPEKSSHQGLRLLGNFVNICAGRAPSA